MCDPAFASKANIHASVNAALRPKLTLSNLIAKLCTLFGVVKLNVATSQFVADAASCDVLALPPTVQVSKFANVLEPSTAYKKGISSLPVSCNATDALYVI